MAGQTGRDIVWTIYGTPQFYASGATVDGYGKVGGCTAPTDLSKLAAYVTALVMRYEGITHIESWVEPTLPGFWAGTADELAAVWRTIYQAAKAVRPSIVVLSSGFESIYPPDTAITTYIPSVLNASDGASGYGRDWIDGLAIHTYHWIARADGILQMSKWGIDIKHALLQAALVAGGLPPDFPVYSTEAGWMTSGDGEALKSQSDAHWVNFIRRHAAYLAALGYKQLIYFRQDNGFHIGHPSANAAVAEAIREVAEWLPGRTLTSIDVMSDGSMRVGSTTGAVYW